MKRHRCWTICAYTDALLLAKEAPTPSSRMRGLARKPSYRGMAKLDNRLARKICEQLGIPEIR